MGFNFEEFEIPEKEIGPLSATVMKHTGVLNFLRMATLTYEISEFSHAVLYWDRSKRVMGVDLKNKQCNNSYDIHGSNSSSGLRINCKEFFQFHEIDFRETYRVTVEEDKETGYLILKGFIFKEGGAS